MAILKATLEVVLVAITWGFGSRQKTSHVCRLQACFSTSNLSFHRLKWVSTSPEAARNSKYIIGFTHRLDSSSMCVGLGMNNFDLRRRCPIGCHPSRTSKPCEPCIYEPCVPSFRSVLSGPPLLLVAFHLVLGSISFVSFTPTIPPSQQLERQPAQQQRRARQQVSPCRFFNDQPCSLRSSDWADFR